MKQRFFAGTPTTRRGWADPIFCIQYRSVCRVCPGDRELEAVSAQQKYRRPIAQVQTDSAMSVSGISQVQTHKISHVENKRLFISAAAAVRGGQPFHPCELARLRSLAVYNEVVEGMLCQYCPGWAAVPGVITLTFTTTEIATKIVCCNRPDDWQWPMLAPWTAIDVDEPESEPSDTDFMPPPKKRRLTKKTSMHNCGLNVRTGRWCPVDGCSQNNVD